MTPESPDSKSRRIQAFIILVELGVIIWLTVALRNSSQAFEAEKESVATLQKALKRQIVGPRWLSVDEVLAWRYIYAKSIGSHKSSAIDQLGEPSTQGANIIYWHPSAKTKNRRVTMALHDNTVVSVTVFPTADEKLHFIETIQDAEQFSFKTSRDTEEDASTLIATKRDGSAVFTFFISSAFHEFEYVEFR